MAEVNRFRLFAAASFVGLFVWLLWDVLFLPNNFGFRDAAHFYYPLFEFVQQEWAAGRVPLWNPYENSGEPLLANSTSSVLYPGKLIFALPIGFAAAYKSYILGHLLLAGGTAYVLARRWGGSIAAATLCGLSYAFSGQILFQVYNVVFLCAAAWLPLAVLTGDSMLVTRRYRHCLSLGVALALMILGGDPQLAYEAGLLVALGAVLYWRAERTERTAKTAADAPLIVRLADRSRVPWYRWRPVLLVVAATWTGVLSAVQVLPTAELSGFSDRAVFDLPRSLSEIPAYLLRDYEPPPQPDGSPADWYDAMLGKPPTRNVHTFATYDFSVMPLRVVECVWPNFSGQMAPVNRRWLGALTREGSSWTPSLYMGLLPFLLALSVWRLRRASPRTAWLSWMVLIGVLGSFGSYGLGWLVRHLFGSDAIADQVGGMYWLLTVVLPGFVQFRYPAKLLTLAALGASGLAACGWQQLMTGEARRLRPWSAAVSVSSLLGLIVLAAIAPKWDEWLTEYQNDYFGPLQPTPAYWDLAESLLHALLLSGLLWLLLWTYHRPKLALSGGHQDHAIHRPWTGTWFAPSLILLTAADLAVAQCGLVITAPMNLWRGQPALASLIDEADRRWASHGGSTDRYRIFGLYEALTADFATTSSQDRVAEGVRRERAGMQPKYGLPERRSIAFAGGTIELFDYQIFVSPMVQAKPREYTQARRALDALGTKYFLLPKRWSIAKADSAKGLESQWLEPRWTKERPQLAPEGPPLPPAVDEPARWFGRLSEDVTVVYNDSHLPRARIVRDLYVTRPVESNNRGKLMPLLETMLFPYDQWLDMRTVAWVEEEALLSYARDGWLLLPPADREESCRIVLYEPQRVEIEVELGAPGLVVLADLFYPGWELTAETDGQSQTLPIVRTNRIMRGALLPAGKHRLIYEYRPPRFYIGAAISAVAWLAAGCAAVGLVVQRQRQKNSPTPS